MLLYSSVVFSIGSIIGAGIFAAQDTIFTISSLYGFYWFVAVLSFGVSVCGVLYHDFPEKLPAAVETFGSSDGYGLYVISGVSFVMTVFWLAAAAGVASLLNGCLYIKSNLYTYDGQMNMSCDGEIITTTFGFVEVLVWCVVCYFLFKRLYSKLTYGQTAVEV